MTVERRTAAQEDVAMTPHDKLNRAGAGDAVTNHRDAHKPYVMLLVGTLASYAAMYLIMYSMVDRAEHVYVNLSNVYMTGLMAGSMVPIMLLTMSAMFPSKRTNAALWVGWAWATGSSCGR